MVKPEILARWKNRLPWRVRRRLERLQLASLRFVRGKRGIALRGGTPSASLIAVGDMSFYGSVEARLRSASAKDLLRSMGPFFSDCDFRIGNLEGMIAERDLRRDGPRLLKSSLRAIDLLTEWGFKIVNLANNHALDCRLAGLEECRIRLQEFGIQSCGSGASPPKGENAGVIEAAGLRVGSLGYCDNFPVRSDGAENGEPAPALDDRILGDIRALRARVDLLILQLHWGWEFSFYPTLSYRERARRFAEAGADLVLCHHSHLPMGVERWKESIITHGLGNFIFPPDPYLRGGHPWTYRSYALKIHFDRLGVLYAEILPYIIDTQGFPRTASEAEAAEILGGVSRASASLKKDDLLDWVERDRTVRDTLSFFEKFPRSDPAGAQGRGLQLRSPCQQDNLRRLRQNCGGAGKRLASLMQRVAEVSSEARSLQALQRECCRADIVSALERLRSANPVLEDLPGRIP